MSSAEPFPLIDICLATYNGIQWLEEFLLSLQRQSYENWRLIVSDDDSSDGTLGAIKSFFDLNPERLLIVERAEKGGGVIANFQDALQASSAEYIFLADQDDIWLPNKLMDLYFALKETEGSEQAPSIVYSDLMVVDGGLKLLCKSWWEYSQVPSSWAQSLRRLLLQNSVPGCSMAFNRRLLDVALPIPVEAVMHDWWILLVASVVGRVAYLSESETILYRRHKGATTYSERGGAMAALKRFLWEGASLQSSYRKSALQAAALLQRTGAQASASDLRLLKFLALSLYRGWFGRRLTLMQGGFVKSSLRGTIRFYFWV